MRKATFPVLDGLGRTIIPVPPVSAYAYLPVAAEGGSTANRPVSPGPRQSYYDTNLLEEIVYNAGRAQWENFIGAAR